MNNLDMKMFADVFEAIEILNEIGPWKKLFIAVYRAELARTGNKEESKESALNTVRFAKFVDRSVA